MQHTKTSIQNPQSTTGPDSIRFDHAECGTIALDGVSAISSLLRIGAITKINKLRHTADNGAYRETATDDKGREILLHYMDDATTGILNGIGVVGKLMAYSCDEIDRDDIHKLGWFIAGLAELAEDVKGDLIELRHEQAETRAASAEKHRRDGEEEKRL